LRVRALACSRDVDRRRRFPVVRLGRSGSARSVDAARVEQSRTVRLGVQRGNLDGRHLHGLGRRRLYSPRGDIAEPRVGGVGAGRRPRAKDVSGVAASRIDIGERPRPARRSLHFVRRQSLVRLGCKHDECDDQRDGSARKESQTRNGLSSVPIPLRDPLPTRATGVR
jgi:hypothetical protein